MLVKLAVVVSAALTLVVVSASAASAQVQNRRPFRGIFGAPPAPDSPHSLVFHASVFAAYDDNVIAGLVERQNNRPWLQRRGTYQGANAGLDYAFDVANERYGFRGHTGVQANYYHYADQSKVLPTYNADVSFNARLTRRIVFSARQSASYTTNYNSGIVPQLDEDAGHDIGVPVDPSLDIFDLRAIRLASTVSLSSTLWRYTSVRAAYHYQHVQYVDAEANNSRFFDYGSHAGSVGINYGRPLTRNATLTLGYAARVSDRRSRVGEPEVMHQINAGVNYARALSFSRRTTLSFSTGSAIAASERVSLPGSDPRTRIHLIGNLALLHEMGRTWAAGLNYSRGYRTIDGFDGLYFTDAVNANLNGLVTRRLSFGAAAAWGDSSIENGTGARHRGTSASARLQYALGAYLALYAHGIYHHYRFTDNIVLDPRLPRRMDRVGVRVGVTTSIPLIR
jgi:hypothetical protein